MSNSYYNLGKEKVEIARKEYKLNLIYRIAGIVLAFVGGCVAFAEYQDAIGKETHRRAAEQQRQFLQMVLHLHDAHCESIKYFLLQLGNYPSNKGVLANILLDLAERKEKSGACSLKPYVFGALYKLGDEAVKEVGNRIRIDSSSNRFSSLFAQDAAIYLLRNADGKLKNWSLPGVAIGAKYLNGLAIRGMDLRGGKFLGTNFDETKFESVNLSETKFVNCALNKAQFVNCVLNMAAFENCAMSEMCIDGKPISQALLEKHKIKISQ